MVKDRDFGVADEPVCFVDGSHPVIDYEDLLEYLKAWPDRLYRYLEEHLVDDESGGFVQGLYEDVCQADQYGPGFEEWRAS